MVIDQRKAHRLRAISLYIQRPPVRVRRHPRPVPGKRLVDNFKHITRGLTAEDVADLRKLSREHGRAR